MKTSTHRTDPFIERLRGPMSYDVMEELAKRNEARVKKVIADMGAKWVGNPDHKIKVSKREKALA